MFWRNGLSVKESGCICNLFSTLQTLLNNQQLRVKNSKLWTLPGSTLCSKRTKFFWFWKCVLKTDFLSVYRKLTKIYRRFKGSCEVTCRRREKNLLDFISCRTLIFFRFFPKRNSLLQFSLTLRRYLKTSMKSNLIRIKRFCQ